MDQWIGRRRPTVWKSEVRGARAPVRSVAVCAALLSGVERGPRVSIDADPDRRLTTVIRRGLILVGGGEERHRVHGTRRPVEAPAEREHERAPVLVAERAIEQKVARGVERHEEIENVAEGSEQRVGVRIRLRLVEDLVDERGRSGRLANEKHHDDGDERDGDADLVGGGPLFAVASHPLALGHRLAQLLAPAHRLDEERVEDDEQRQRKQYLLIAFKKNTDAHLMTRDMRLQYLQITIILNWLTWNIQQY